MSQPDATAPSPDAPICTLPNHSQPNGTNHTHPNPTFPSHALPSYRWGTRGFRTRQSGSAPSVKAPRTMPFTDMTTAKTRAQLTRRRMELVRKNKMAEIRIKRVYMALGVPRVRIETIGHPVINHMKRKITYDVDEAGAIHLRVSGHVEYQYATGIPITKKLKAPGQD